MRNHFHWVIETPSANLVTGMSQMEERRRWETQADHRQIRRGWRLGNDQFRKELPAVGKSVGGSHYGSERQERDQKKANRLVNEELRRLDWTEKELAQRPKGDKQKVETARMLRQQTTMTLKWIAQRLHMGSWTYVSNLLHQNQRYNVNSEDRAKVVGYPVPEYSIFEKIYAANSEQKSHL